MKKITYLFSILIVCFLFVNCVNAASLSLSPNKGDYKLNEKFSVEILLDTEGEAVDGADVHLNYPSNILEAVKVIPGDLMSQTMMNKINSEDGSIHFSQITDADSYFTSSGQQMLATVVFKSIKEGNAKVDFDFTAGDTRDSNVAAKGNDVLNSVKDGEYKVIKNNFIILLLIFALLVLLIIISVFVILNKKKDKKEETNQQINQQ